MARGGRRGLTVADVAADVAAGVAAAVAADVAADEPSPTRRLLVCADDYGQSSAIDAAIGSLVLAGRLGAFSCLSNAQAWWADAPAVAGLRRAGAQAGLHFNLTDGRPLSPALARHWPQLPSLPRLLLAAHSGRLPLAAIADELAAQWRAFEAASGAAPDFVDGHQHVHHLPGVRDVLLAWLRSHPVPVRSTARVAGPGSGIKRWVIAHSGGRALAAALTHAGVPHNHLLLGAYDFAATDYRALMQAWLAQVPVEGALLFCHPGQASLGGPAAPDAIAAARVRELAYLAGDDFPADLAAAGVVAGVAAGRVWRGTTGARA